MMVSYSPLKSRTRRGSMLVVVVILAALFPLLAGAPAAHAAPLGGPVILGGDDLTDHGSFFNGQNQNGWLYIQKALENLKPNVTRTNDNSVAALGSAASSATSSDGGAAIGRAAAAAGLTVNYFNGGPAIEQFFSDLRAGAAKPAIIWIAGDDSNNDLSDSSGAEAQALTNNAATMGDFVNSGGGLMSHGTEYGWLFALLPGGAAVDSGGSNLTLTPDGMAAFPGLTNNDINSGPWHNHFTGNLGGLKTLATDVFGGNTVPVIIGGSAVVLPGSITLDPPTAQNPVGTPHTVTATVRNQQGNLDAGKVVTFTITSGPNTGATGTCNPATCATGANGSVTFTYTGSAGPGTDTIQACFVDSQSATKCTQATKTWGGIAPLALATTASSSVPAGGIISDTATLTGGSSPAGTVTFNLFGPDNTTCAGAAIFTSAAVVTGAGTAVSDPYTATLPGVYRWVAAYSGDANNGPLTGACNDTNESVVVTPQTMTGRAYGASVNLLGSQLIVPSPDTGPVSTTTAGSTGPPCLATLAGLVNATALCANVTTTVGPSASTATASIAQAAIATGITGVPAISVTGVKATSTSDCSGSTGGTTIANLSIGGAVIDVSNLTAPNSTLHAGVAILILNEHLGVVGADQGLTVNALHLIVPDVLDIVLASATSDMHNCPGGRGGPLPVSVAYADSTRVPEFTPEPWVGSPNVAWVGIDGGALLNDSGAVRIDNPTGVAIPGVRVTVDIGSHHFDLWGANTIPANGQLVLFQTVPLISFDTSDVAPGPCDSPSTIIPVIHVSANGFARDYRDYAKVLTTGGIDRGDCTGLNEGQQWQPATAVPVPAPHDVAADFDGDARTDLSVFRPSTSQWFVRNSADGSSVQSFGLTGDIPVMADYNGDGHDDVAIFRPSVGGWYVRPSGGGPDVVTFFGLPGDIPAPGDYDGDGRADQAVFRPSVGGWYVHPSVGSADFITFFGLSGDIPVPGYYDTDGRADMAVYRPSTGTWYVHPSGGGDTSTVFGVATDIPAPGDYDGDGRADLAVFRPSSSTWFVQPSGGGAMIVTPFGQAGDIPAPGDYDGDGKTDLGVFRPSVGAWFIHRSTGTDTVDFFGLPGDRPMPLPSAIRQVFFP